MKKYLLYILGLSVFIYLLINMDFKSLLIFTKSISLDYILFLLSLQLVTIVLLGIQWKLIISWIKEDVKFYDALRVNLKGNIVDALSPGVKVGGELARIYEIRKILGMDLGEAILVVGLQKTLSITSFLILVLFSLIWLYITTAGSSYFKSLLFPIFTFIIVLVSILFLFMRLKAERVKNLLDKIKIEEKKREKIYNGVKEYKDNMDRMLKDKTKFYFQLALSVFIWLLFAIKFAILVKGYGVDMDFISVAAITYLTYIIGMIPFLPGGIGSFETSMVGLLALKGVEIGQGVAISLVFRFITFWFEFLISFLVLFFDRVLRYITMRKDRYVKDKN